MPPVESPRRLWRFTFCVVSVGFAPAVMNSLKPESANLLKRTVCVVSCAVAIACGQASAGPLTRPEALSIAESFVNHRWQASVKNLHHGVDSDGVEVHTPDRDGGHGDPLDACWSVNSENLGVAYKWGGFDTPQSFDAGIRAGKAAGDVYTAAKRQKGGDAVSGEAVGIDCSGFISRCWKLSTKHSTESLASICLKLSSATALQPADIMNEPGGHVILFVKWLDGTKTRALFYESAPFSKTLASERVVAELVTAGYQPMRYRQIHD